MTVERKKFLESITLSNVHANDAALRCPFNLQKIKKCYESKIKHYKPISTAGWLELHKEQDYTLL